MKERWVQVKPDADEKQEMLFNEWLEGKGISFEDGGAQKKYRERTRMIKDAIQLKRTPERIPINLSVGYFPIEYAGYTYYDMMYDQALLIKAWNKFYQDFDPDVFTGPLPMVGKALELLDFQLYRWPGHGLPKDREFQFVDKEYMRPDEYQDLIDDPTAWFLTVYFPRIFKSLKPLDRMAVFPSVNELPMVIPAVAPFGDPAVQEALNALVEAGRVATQWLKGLSQLGSSIMAKGYPALRGGGLVKAPFDVLGDSLRGTRGIMMDLFRCPDDVKEACERMTPLMVKAGVQGARASGGQFIFIPLHKGADGFMSDEQFQTFYWPTLRKVMIGLIDEGLVPVPFAEGSYNTRLDMITDLPKGKTIWIFDRSDMKRAKETIGQVACIQGNMPLSLMCAGTVDQVKVYCRDVIEAAGRDGGYILSTGGSLQGAKAENVKAFIDAGREYGA
jgi:hypothetical protein